MLDRLDRERWGVVSPYLDQALELTREQRPEWLETLRARDATLAADVEALLEEHRALEEEGFLEGRPLSSPPPPSLAGQVLGAYTLRRLIGQGGMGTVWAADRSDGRFQGVAAVKLLNASLLGREGEARFKREGSILARLRHPHVAQLIDAGVSPVGQPFLVLEHVDGQHIDRYCEAGHLGVDARIRLFLDVVEAVAHAHANLIVHRDLKPSNVLVARDDQVKLLDFGIAKLLDPEGGAGDLTALTREGHGALTPEYAAPEQLTGADVTTVTDVYALGVLLYVLLTGQHPAGGGLRSAADLVRSIVETEPTRASEVVAVKRLARQLQGDLDNIVAKALKKRPSERYPSAGALADDLRRYLGHQPVSARPDALSYRAAKFVRRHAGAVAAAAAVTLLVTGLVGFSATRLAAERDRAHREAEKAAKVSALLTGLLTASDPYDRDKREPTVREVLDAGAERIEKELAGQADLQADMLTVMGRVYQRLGAHDKARPLLERAVTIGRASGAENEQLAQTLNDLGVLLDEKGDYAAAGSLLEEALAMRRRVLGPEHEDVAVTLVELGRVYSDRGQLESAEPLFREALAIRRRVLGEDHRETATSVSDLALLLRQKGDLAGAESLFRENLERTRKALGEDHPDMATALSNLALVVGEKGRPAEAEAMIRRALVISRKVLGDQHPDVAAKLNNLSNVLREQGKYDEAASVIEEALRIARPTLSGDHPLVARYTLSLARIQLARGQPKAAEPLLRHALQTFRNALGEDDWRTGMAKSLLGATLTTLARYGEAEALLVDAQRVLKDVPGTQGREASATRDRLAALYQAWGKPEKATPYR